MALAFTRITGFGLTRSISLEHALFIITSVPDNAQGLVVENPRKMLASIFLLLAEI
jgi:hypothetical protein